MYVDSQYTHTSALNYLSAQQVMSPASYHCSSIFFITTMVLSNTFSSYLFILLNPDSFAELESKHPIIWSSVLPSVNSGSSSIITRVPAYRAQQKWLLLLLLAFLLIALNKSGNYYVPAYHTQQK